MDDRAFDAAAKLVASVGSRRAFLAVALAATSGGGATAASQRPCRAVRCANVQSNRCHCGECNRRCLAGHTCCEGECIDLRTDPANCGTCGQGCPPGERCCDGTCVDLDRDERNCGACGRSCGEGERCCAGRCADLNRDDEHCGDCGNACNEVDRCCDGRCVCQSADDHCGACGRRCGARERCLVGRCREYGGFCADACRMCRPRDFWTCAGRCNRDPRSFLADRCLLDRRC